MESFKERNTKFAQFLIESENRTTEGKSIYYLLVQPLQRIQLYLKITRSLIKLFIDENHNDYALIKESIDYFSQIEEFTKEKKFTLENLIKLADIKETIKLWGLVQENRKLEMEIELREVIKSNSRSRKLYIFNNLMVLCSLKKKNQPTKPKTYELIHISFNDVPDCKDAKNAFEITYKGKDKKKFSLMTHNEKTFVINRFKEIQKELMENRKK